MLRMSEQNNHMSTANYHLSKKSIRNMAGGDSDLIRVAFLAIQWTYQDFTVPEMLRTPEQQAEAKAGGKSQTLKSRHLTGHAIHALPWVPGRGVVWDEEDRFDKIAVAFREAGQALRIDIRWGGAWPYLLTDESMSPFELRQRYRKLRTSDGREPFNDLAHFERPRLGFIAARP